MEEEIEVEVRDACVGRGVFALRDFPAGAFIGLVRGRLISDDDYTSDYCMEFSETESLEPEPPFRFLNHSCDPNVELVVLYDDDDDLYLGSRLTVFATKNIYRGEEMFLDYAWPSNHAIPCKCSAENCRGWIVCEEELNDVLPPPLYPTAEQNPLSQPPLSPTGDEGSTPSPSEEAA